MMSHSRFILSFLSALAILAGGCSPEKSGADAATALLFFQKPAVTCLGSGTVYYESQNWNYSLLKLEYPGKASAYAAWIPPLSGTRQPAVVMTNPYIGIRWNGDDPGPGVTVYSTEDYIKSGYIFLLNGFGVLHVFERFYAEGDLQNEVDDTVAGLQYLETEPLADAGRIGIYGGSWGGFESLYGAANAPAGAVPAAGVALYPPSDFADFDAYVTARLPAAITDAVKKDQYLTFFQQYLDRIRATPGWESWTGSALLAKLKTPFLVVHDEWDTLVPAGQSRYLVVNSAGKVEPLWFYQAAPIDLNGLNYGWGHGELRTYQLDANPPDAFAWGMMDAFTTAYVIRRLAGADQLIMLGYNAAALADFISYAREYKCGRGRGMEWAALRLLDIADSRAYLFEVNTKAVTTGLDAVAGAFSAAGWGGPSYASPATLESALQAGLPACP